MEKIYTVGHYLVDRLKQLGLGHLFSIAGDYSIEWIDEYVRPSGIQIIEEVNELNAGYAADGYARLKGIGALCVTYSAGALSAANPIGGAYTERVPVVLINGAPSVKRTLTYEQTGFSAHHFISGRQTNLQVFEYITSAAVRIDNAALAPLQIDYALTQCVTKRSPVYIELLQDIVKLPCAPPRGELQPAEVASDPDSLKVSLEEVKKKFEGKSEERAKKPLLWVGVEVDRFGLQNQVKKLIWQLNIPYVTQFMSKGVLPEDDRLFAGVFDGQASSSEVQKLVKESDFILALGVWLTDINTLGWGAAEGHPNFNLTAFVSLETVKFGTFFSAQVSLADLIDGLLSDKVTCNPRSIPLQQDIQMLKHLAEPITYQGFYEFLAEKEYICRNTIIGSDPSLNYFGSMHLKVGTERGYIAQSSYSSIGYIGPAATGMSLARPDKRIVVFTGDGGFQMTAQCLSTQIRYGLNPIIFVINNGVFGVEQWLHNAAIFPNKGKYSASCEMHSWNYSKLSEVFDTAANTVEPSGYPTGFEPLLNKSLPDDRTEDQKQLAREETEKLRHLAREEKGKKMFCRSYKVRTYGQLQEAIEGIEGAKDEGDSGAIHNTKGPSVIEVLVDRYEIPENARWKEMLDGKNSRS